MKGQIAMKVLFTQRLKNTLYHVWKLKANEKDMEYIGAIKNENGVYKLHLIGDFDTETNRKYIFLTFRNYYNRKGNEK